MKAIRFYQIPFSHFCIKVRWALDFYSVPFQAINYIGPHTPGLEKAPRTLQKLSPIIEDPNNESLFISDSTPILLYLDNHYGNKKSLFPSNINTKKDDIIQYCLKLDSELGLYTRNLAYLYVISEKPAILSVLVDGNFDKVSFDDWKSYYRGLLGCCFIIARLGIHRIEEEHIFAKTVSLLEEIKQNIEGKQYLFDNQFTAADLTLTSLMQPLVFVTPLFEKYKSIFEFCNRIRERHDPNYQKAKIEYVLEGEREKRQRLQKQSPIRNLIWKTSQILFYPLQFFFTDDKKKPLLQYPSTNINEKAHNNVRVMKLKSAIKFPGFLIKYLWHLCFTLPKQMEFVKNEGNKILHK